MRRRSFITLLGGAAVAWPLTARAEQSKKIPRLCFLTFDPGTLQATRFAFFEGLRDLGYVDGRSINIDYLSAEARKVPGARCRMSAPQSRYHRCKHHPGRSGGEECNPHHPDRHDRTRRSCGNRAR